jgi:predicted HAD superfamily phosphohydrolase YqeG
MRTEDIARRLTSDGGSTTIKVEPMSETDALRLLRNNWVETPNTGQQRP